MQAVYASEHPGYSKYKVGRKPNPFPNPVIPPGDIFTNMGFRKSTYPGFLAAITVTTNYQVSNLFFAGK